MAAGDHFGWPRITFDRIFLVISDQYATFFSQNGCRRPFWITENNFWKHFSPFQINTQLLFYFIFLNGCRRPFWMTENHFRLHFLPFQINTQLFFHKMAAGGHFGWLKITFDRISRHFRSIRNFNYFHKMAAGGHFGWPKITFDRISRHFRSIRNFDFFSQNGCWRPFWMTENHFWSHFSPFQINTQLFFFFTKWLPAAILDDRKSLFIAFLAISYQYATLIFFSQNGCWRPFWITENNFWMHFSPFQINTQLLFYFIFLNGCRRPFWMTENHFRLHFSPFQINTQLFFHKMADNGHFGWPKITFDRISRHFRSIRNFYFFSQWRWGQRRQWRWPKITFYRISRHFRSIRNFDFFSQNGCWRPFWMTENHFWSHFSPFQINTQLFFFTKWLPAAILDDRKSLFIAFLAISDQYATLIFFHKMAAGGHFGWPKITF